MGSCDAGMGDTLAAPLRFVVPPLRDCASANGITQTARSRSTYKALLIRCALMVGLICFFNLRDRL